MAQLRFGGMGNREQGTGNREWETENGEQGIKIHNSSVLWISLISIM